MPSEIGFSVFMDRVSSCALIPKKKQVYILRYRKMYRNLFKKGDICCVKLTLQLAISYLKRKNNETMLKINSVWFD
jgi:hypothetical protein|tara:strand:+ start:3769 stop:3996 length:228 start_codon:yes stop_codon:yes gene_type:complete